MASSHKSERIMTLYSYIVKHDGGFAPNPFFGYCTLACCKPGIRRKAQKGDWVVGLTPKDEGNRIVYIMEVEEILDFKQYWRDPRFRLKKPSLNAGAVRMVGDNIYQPQPGGGFRQVASVHSKPEFGNRENPGSKKRDLSGNRVLVSRNFAYFGSRPKVLPATLKVLITGRAYKCRFSTEVQQAFRHFVSKQPAFGLLAAPHGWSGDESWKHSACFVRRNQKRRRPRSSPSPPQSCHV